MRSLMKRRVPGIRRKRGGAAPDARPVALFVGTENGLYVFRSNGSRTTWSREGPFITGKDMNVITVDPHDPNTVYAGASQAGIFKSRDGGRSWAKLKFPPATDAIRKYYTVYSGKHPVDFANDTGMLDKQFGKVWSIAVHPKKKGVVYAGFEPPALFRSDNEGQTWTEMASMRRVPFSHLWWGPFGAAFVTTIGFDPKKPATMILGVSGGAGVVVSRNGGKTWKSALKGMTTFTMTPDGKLKKFSIKTAGVPARLAKKGAFVDVHKLRVHPMTPRVVYSVNHEGQFISTTGGARWTPTKSGLPAACSRTLAIHARDPKKAWIIPLPGDHKGGIPCIQGDVVVYRTQNMGKKWTPHSDGLPKGVELNIYRDGMDADGLQPCGVYFGTSRGELFYSIDEGESWQAMAINLPSVRAITPYAAR